MGDPQLSNPLTAPGAHSTTASVPSLDNPMVVRYPPVDLVRRILHAPGEHRIMVAATGAAADLGADLFRIGGASGKIIESIIPYRQSRVAGMLGYAPERSVSEEVAIGMANSSYLSAQESAVLHEEIKESGPKIQSIGVGLTGAVATNRDRRGDDHFWIAIRTNSGISTGHFQLAKGKGDDARAQQNEDAVLVALNSIVEAMGGEQRPVPSARVSAAEKGEVRDHKFYLHPYVLPNISLESPIIIMPDGSTRDAATIDPKKHVIYPGSFRSFHCGHDLAGRIARLTTDKTPIFEIAGANFAKGSVTDAELLRRAAQLAGRYPVLIRRDAGAFVDKSEAYPAGIRFVVGYDTAERLLRPPQDGEQSSGEPALERLSARGNKFYVLGRHDANGHFATVEDLPISEKHRHMFQPLAGALKISATLLG